MIKTPEYKTYYYFQFYLGSAQALLTQLVNPQHDCVGDGLTGKWIKARGDGEAKKKMLAEINKGKKMAEGLTRQEPNKPFCFVAIQLMTGRGRNERVLEQFTINSQSNYVPPEIRKKLATFQFLNEGTGNN